MDLTEELNNLVFVAQRNYKKFSKNSLTQKVIAKRLVIRETYLSDLLRGNKPVSEKLIADFKLRFSEELGSMTPDRIMLRILKEELANVIVNNNKEEADKLINSWEEKVRQELSSQ